MNIKEALQTVIMADTSTEEWRDRKISALPKTDVIVHRPVLRAVLAEIERLERIESAARKMLTVGAQGNIAGLLAAGDELRRLLKLPLAG